MPSTRRIQPITVEGRGDAENRDSRLRGGRCGLVNGGAGRAAETVTDRLRESRPIHLFSYIGDNVSCHLDPATLFHEATLS